jgi:hypothetical protein
VWNQALDSAYVFKQLIAPDSTVQLVNITNPQANLLEAEQLIDKAQATPQGRARLALSAALGEIPGWFDPTSPAPAASDVVAQEFNQYHWLRSTGASFAYSYRAELEQRAGGNPSWNSGVDYGRALAVAPGNIEVETLYRQAGLDLNADLNTLAASSRIAPNPFPIGYLRDNIIFNGDFGRVPVLTLHTIGDGLAVTPNEAAYASPVEQYGRPELLRQVWVNRAGHCSFTPAETVAAFQGLVARLDTGTWQQADATTLNAQAEKLGPVYNVAGGRIDATHPSRPTAAAFTTYRPAPFLRPFSAFSLTPSS